MQIKCHDQLYNLQRIQNSLYYKDTTLNINNLNKNQSKVLKMFNVSLLNDFHQLNYEAMMHNLFQKTESILKPIFEGQKVKIFSSNDNMYKFLIFPQCQSIIQKIKEYSQKESQKLEYYFIQMALIIKQLHKLNCTMNGNIKAEQFLIYKQKNQGKQIQRIVFNDLSKCTITINNKQKDTHSFKKDMQALGKIFFEIIKLKQFPVKLQNCQNSIKNENSYQKDKQHQQLDQFLKLILKKQQTQEQYDAKLQQMNQKYQLKFNKQSKQHPKKYNQKFIKLQIKDLKQKDIKKKYKQIQIYKFQRGITSGGQGSIFIGYLKQKQKQNGKIVVLKKLKIKQQICKDIERQAKVLFKIRKKNSSLITILDYIETTNDNFYFVIDYYSNGSLRDNLPLIKNMKSENLIIQMFKRIVQGVYTLHYQIFLDQGIIHRNLQPSNILLTQNFNPIIIDFRLSKISKRIYQKHYHSFYQGTTYYLSPQILNKQAYSGKVDIWSLGVILFQLLFPQRLFSSNQKHIIKEQQNKIQQILKNQFQNNKLISFEFKNVWFKILTECLRYRQSKRIDAKQLIKLINEQLFIILKCDDKQYKLLQDSQQNVEETLSSVQEYKLYSENDKKNKFSIKVIKNYDESSQEKWQQQKVIYQKLQKQESKLSCIARRLESFKFENKYYTIYQFHYKKLKERLKQIDRLNRHFSQQNQKQIQFQNKETNIPIVTELQIHNIIFSYIKGIRYLRQSGYILTTINIDTILLDQSDNIVFASLVGIKQLTKLTQSSQKTNISYLKRLILCLFMIKTMQQTQNLQKKDLQELIDSFESNQVNFQNYCKNFKIEIHEMQFYKKLVAKINHINSIKQLVQFLDCEPKCEIPRDKINQEEVQSILKVNPHSNIIINLRQNQQQLQQPLNQKMMLLTLQQKIYFLEQIILGIQHLHSINVTCQGFCFQDIIEKNLPHKKSDKQIYHFTQYGIKYRKNNKWIKYQKQQYRGDFISIANIILKIIYNVETIETKEQNLNIQTKQFWKEKQLLKIVLDYKSMNKQIKESSLFQLLNLLKQIKCDYRGNQKIANKLKCLNQVYYDMLEYKS